MFVILYVKPDGALNQSSCSDKFIFSRLGPDKRKEKGQQWIIILKIIIIK